MIKTHQYRICNLKTKTEEVKLTLTSHYTLFQHLMLQHHFTEYFKFIMFSLCLITSVFMICETVLNILMLHKFVSGEESEAEKSDRSEAANNNTQIQG